MSVAVHVGGLLLQALVRRIGLGLVGEVPHIDVVGGRAADLHRTVLAEDVEGLL